MIELHTSSEELEDFEEAKREITADGEHLIQVVSYAPVRKESRSFFVAHWEKACCDRSLARYTVMENRELALKTLLLPDDGVDSFNYSGVFDGRPVEEHRVSGDYLLKTVYEGSAEISSLRVDGLLFGTAVLGSDQDIDPPQVFFRSHFRLLQPLWDVFRNTGPSRGVPCDSEMFEVQSALLKSIIDFPELHNRRVLQVVSDDYCGRQGLGTTS